jgi:predicted RecA/RadA family phage recombinase
MAALTQARNTPQRGFGAVPDLLELGVSASTTCYQGGIAVLNGGFLEPATEDTGLICVGRFEQDVTNDGADGAVNAKVRQGVFKFANSTSTDEIAAADRGATCYLVDDQTVAKTDGSSARSAAGIVWDVDSDGVWVLMGLGV